MKIFLCFFAFIMSIGVKAQSSIVSVDSMNIAYIGLDNPLTIVIENCKCANLFATTDNGTLKRKDSCHFNFLPERTGNATITIQKKQNGKLIKIGEQILKCKPIPNPRAVIGNKSSGSFPLKQFKLQKGINVVFDSGFGMDSECTILSFTIAVFLNPCGDYFEDIVGNCFSSKSIAFFNSLKPGDKVFIENIKYKGFDNKVCPMNPMAFTMR